MLEIENCTRNNLCIDCNDKKCLHAGKAMSDCPKYHCDNKYESECDKCDFMEQYQKEMRKYYEEKQ